MSTSGSGERERGNLERLGESAGAMAGRAADFGMEVTGSLFRSASEMLGGWWSSDAPRDAATTWHERAEDDCRSHFHAAGATQATGTAPKSTHAAMPGNNSGMVTESDTGEVSVAGSARVGSNAERATSPDRARSQDSTTSPDSATDGFVRARPGYQLGYVARQNPAYRGRSFSEVEPELRRVWEAGARTEGGARSAGGTWPEVRGFVDFAYQQSGDDDTRR